MSKKLKASNARSRTLMGIGLAFAGFSICWAVIAISLGGPRTMGLFIIPFVLVGLAIIGAGLWQMVARARVPAPELSVSNESPRIGETLTLTYQQTFKKPVQVQRMLIQLIMRESATYRRGTNTYTVSHEDIIEEFEHPGRAFSAGEIFFDEQKMQIPVDSMHSFSANRNKIMWLIKIKVEVEKWADLNQEFNLLVLPELASNEEAGVWNG